MTKHPFHAYFDRILSAKGLTPEQFATGYGLPLHEVRAIASGQAVPEPDELAKWVKHLGLSAESAKKWHEFSQQWRKDQEISDPSALAQVSPSEAKTPLPQGKKPGTARHTRQALQKVADFSGRSPHWICLNCWTPLMNPGKPVHLWILWGIVLAVLLGFGILRALGEASWMLFILWLVVGLPILLIWTNRSPRCTCCGSSDLIPADSPRALVIAETVAPVTP